MTEESKKINITGVNNKYLIKKLTTENNFEKKIKKRLQSKKWSFSNDYFEYINQIRIVKNILNNCLTTIDDNIVLKIAIQEINKKIYSYKQQDKLKNIFDEINFISFESVINKMNECELKCRYCKNEMNVLYDISREMKQWSVDRIDNDVGHNINNFHLACLECNLKRRRRSDEKFLFTKQLNIIKQEYKFINDI
jgi:hypothetical protein